MDAAQEPAELQDLFRGFAVEIGTPRKLPKPSKLEGRVAVLDIAFASEGGGRRNAFEHTTLRFIEGLGPRLVAWVDHHDSEHHTRFADDRRFLLATKAEHGACPEMITPSVVASVGRVDTIVCHDDFDGLASAAKWIRGGVEPYPGCDEDARAIDTRIGELGPVGTRFDRALRARYRDRAFALHVVAFLASGLADDAMWIPIDAAGGEYDVLEARARALADGYRALSGELVWVDVTGTEQRYDKTLLLLLGQQRARMAAVLDGDTLTFAAAFDSGVNFLERFQLSGGMPTLVSLQRARLEEALTQLGVSATVVGEVAAQAAQHAGLDP
jgi:hypothetical protein